MDRAQTRIQYIFKAQMADSPHGSGVMVNVGWNGTSLRNLTTLHTLSSERFQIIFVLPNHQERQSLFLILLY